MNYSQACRQRLFWWLKNRPMRQIDVNGQPYLQRYFVASVLGFQIWCHRFVAMDGEPHLHSHPWTALSVMLCGSYREVWFNKDGEFDTELRTVFSWPRLITPKRRHRIVWVERNTWTLMVVGPSRSKHWHFYDHDGQVTETLETSDRNWWRWV